MPRKRRPRKEPLNDPGGLETIFENTEDEEDSSSISPVKKFVLGICARRRSLSITQPWANSKDKTRHRKKMIKKHGQKPLELISLTPSKEETLKKLLEEEQVSEDDEEEECRLKTPLNGRLLQCKTNLLPQPPPPEEDPPFVTAEILKELQEADAICGPIPFLTEPPKERSKGRKSTTVLVRRSSRFLSNKENRVIGTVFEEKELSLRKPRSRSMVATSLSG